MRRLALALLLLLPAALRAQEEFSFYGRGPYRTGVPKPEALLGYRLGTQQTMYHQQQDVLDRLIAAAPDRVRTEIIGRTQEGKIIASLFMSLFKQSQPGLAIEILRS